MNAEAAVRMLTRDNRRRLIGLALRIEWFERRYPHHTAEAHRARRARELDIYLDHLLRAERLRDRWRGLGGVRARVRGHAALNAWKQRRYAARRAGWRFVVDVWIAGRPL